MVQVEPFNPSSMKTSKFTINEGRDPTSLPSIVTLTGFDA
jgi:hypothetical protein